MIPSNIQTYTHPAIPAPQLYTLFYRLKVFNWLYRRLVCSCRHTDRCEGGQMKPLCIHMKVNCFFLHLQFKSFYSSVWLWCAEIQCECSHFSSHCSSTENIHKFSGSKTNSLQGMMSLQHIFGTFYSEGLRFAVSENVRSDTQKWTIIKSSIFFFSHIKVLEALMRNRWKTGVGNLTH